jgi:hypothetical protein
MLEFIQNLINNGHRELSFGNDCIEVSVVYAESIGRIFFLTSNTGEEKGQLLF